jgi:hypothetical protein
MTIDSRFGGVTSAGGVPLIEDLLSSLVESHSQVRRSSTGCRFAADSSGRLAGDALNGRTASLAS